MDAASRAMLDLGVILFASFIGAAIFERLKLPPVIGMILAGIALSPFTPGFVVESNGEITLFAQLGGILLMFVLGLHFEYHHVKRMGTRGFVLAGVASVATFAAGAAAGWLFGMGIAELLIIGAFFVSTSTTMALRMMQEMGLENLKNAKIMQAAIVIDDLYGFIVLSLISGFIGVQGASVEGAVLASLTMLAAIVLIFFAGVRIVPIVFEFFEERFPSSALTLGTAFCLIMVYFLMLFNVSPFIGAFLAGTVLTSSIRYKDVIKSVMPVRNLFANVFFASIGLLLDPFLLLGAMGLIAVLSAVAIISKWAAAGAVLVRYGSSPREAAKLGLMTSPRGEVLLIIAENVVLAGVVQPIFLAIATGIVLLSAFAPPFIMAFSGAGGAFAAGGRRRR